MVQRLLGLAELRLETAGASGSEAHLQYVGEERADSLQREISRLRGAGDAEPTDGDAFETVFEISPKELGLLALVSADLRLFSILALGASVVAPSVAPMAEQWLAVGVESVVRGLFGTAATLAFLVVVGLLYGVVNATLYYGFTLHRAPEELRYERGLFQRYSGTVPLGKVQSLTVGENVLARALGYASLDIETAGGSGREQDQNNSQSAVPLASRERVFELTNSIEAVGDVAFERPPTRARERYAVRYSGVVLAVTALLFLIQTAFSSSLFWWAPLGLLAVVPVAAHLKWKQRGVFVGPNHVVTRNGFWVRKTKIVPYYRVQTVLSSETVFQRRRRLGTVTVDTAGARSLLGDDATAVDIDAERTEELRERVANELYAALRRPGGPAQSDGRTDGPATGEGRSLDGYRPAQPRRANEFLVATVRLDSRCYDASWSAGRVTVKVEPSQGSESTRMSPPWRSTMRSHSASPMPVPPYSSRLWSRSKMLNTRSRSSASMPMPSSATETEYASPRRVASTWTVGGPSL